MADDMAPMGPATTVEPVPPPRRRRAVAALGIDAVHLVTGLGLLPRAGSVVALVRFIVCMLRARPIIPFNRNKQPPARARHLAWARLSYAARAVIERFFGLAHYLPIQEVA